MNKRNNILLKIGIIILLIIFFSLQSIANLITDFWWFESLGFKELFMTFLMSRVYLFSICAAVLFTVIGINLYISQKANPQPKTILIGSKTKYGLAALLSIFFSFSISLNWFRVLQYMNQNGFGLTEPIFLKDIAFYVFSLPFYNFIWEFVFASIVISMIVILFNYFETFIEGMVKPPQPASNIDVVNKKDYKQQFQKLGRFAKVHLATIGGFIFLMLGVRNFLDMYEIMFSEKGIVVGAGFTDTVVFLPALKALVVISLIIAVLFFVWIFFFSKDQKFRKRHILMYGVAVYLIFNLLATTVVPEIVQSLKVSPNEFSLEKPFIENNIKYTKLAYGLDKVEEKDFLVDQKLTQDIIEEETGTIDNIRLLDWRPLTETYKQTQEIRLYYDLSGIDVDRYWIDGKYRQVMIAPRELDQSKILENAKTWVNLHHVYTHGYGVVVSPVSEVTSSGLPNYLLGDIPPVSAVDEERFEITNPRIYYGEKDNQYVIVNTDTLEFDYPKGDENEYFQYDGNGGVVLDSFTKKLLMAFRFKDVKILLSSDINTDSKIMFNRNIRDRISIVAPFLKLDRDPYIVINEGRLFWIQDAYTVTSNYPYSQKVGKLNYIRNSVKIVVDAYNGNVDMYIIDEVDPIVKTYANMFPEAFKNINEMPEGLKMNLRYPQDLFELQSEIYSTYHMNNANVFYNKEDAWQIPNEVYGTGRQIKAEPYYIVMSLDGVEQFVLMTAFTPIKKDNMIGWLAAKNDEDYGKLILYKFPKDKLISGPLQIEAKFDQDSEISEQLTLWSQQGSELSRGNLLVIPLQDTLLYVEPLYIQAETGQVPQLTRVLVSDGDNVVMERDFKTALRALFKESDVRVVTDNNRTVEQLVARASQYYELVLDSMKENDFEGMGKNYDLLGDTLSNLEVTYRQATRPEVQDE